MVAAPINLTAIGTLVNRMGNITLTPSLPLKRGRVPLKKVGWGYIKRSKMLSFA